MLPKTGAALLKHFAPISTTSPVSHSRVRTQTGNTEKDFVRYQSKGKQNSEGDSNADSPHSEQKPPEQKAAEPLGPPEPAIPPQPTGSRLKPYMENPALTVALLELFQALQASQEERHREDGPKTYQTVEQSFQAQSQLGKGALIDKKAS